jgi:aminocarboxymuconate-semialdehyde decarboxylase
MSRSTPQETESPEGSAIRISRNRKSLVVDIHCHLNIPAADELMRPHLAGQLSIHTFSCAATDDTNRKQFERIGRTLNVIDERLAYMDRLGVDIQAISPVPTQYYYFADADLGREAARIVNDGIATAVARHPDRLIGMGTVPLQVPELAVIEMKRCISDLGLRGIEISSNVAGRELADAQFWPFFAAAEELGVLLFMHPLGFTHGQRLSQHYLNNLIGNPLESTIALSHLIFGGVLERYPGLRLCVAHGGGYLPTYWGRMDHAWRERDDCRQFLPRPPSEYLRRLYFDTVVFDQKHQRFLLETYGPEQLLMGTDYPFDMAESEPVRFHEELDPLARQKILGGNAVRLLGLTETRTS